MPVHADIALYDQITDDAERDIFAVVSGSVASLTENIPQAEIRGVEADGDVRPTGWLTLGYQLAYTDAEWTKPSVTLPGGVITDASSYANAPRWSGSIFGKVDLPTSDSLGKMSIRADLYAQTDFYFSNFYNTLSPGTKLPGYSLLNLRYDWKIFNSNVSLAVWAKNVLDRAYLSGGTAFAPSSGANVAFAGAPRTVGVEASYKF